MIDPTAMDRFQGRSFTLEDAKTALGMQKSNANDDNRLFNEKYTVDVPEIAEWVKDPNGDAFKRYRLMSLVQLRKHIESEKAIAAAADEKKSGKSQKEKGKKRRQATPDSGSEEAEPTKRSKGKGKGKKGKGKIVEAAFDSENMDSE